MYKLYKGAKASRIVLFCVGVFFIYEGFGVVLPLVVKEGVNVQYALLFVGAIVIGLLLFGMSCFMKGKSPYAFIEKLRMENPELVCRYEKEFEAAKKIGENIWASEHFYYIRTVTELKVIAIDQLKKIHLYETYARTKTYDIELYTENEIIKVTVATGSNMKDAAIRCAEKLADCSSIVVESDLH